MQSRAASRQSDDKILQICDLGITYFSAKDNAVRALDGVSLDVYRGEILAVLGESGCGKSTLASAVLRLLSPNARVESGEILFKGYDSQRCDFREHNLQHHNSQNHNLQECNILSLRERKLQAIRGREISLISQDPALALNPVLTVGAQISEVLRAHLPLSAKQRRERVYELLTQVGFEKPSEIYQAYPHQLSGGQRQRIVIAQAIACGPSVIIADEPTSKLDASLRTEIVQLLLKIRGQNGATLIIISHDPAMVAGIADRVAVMRGGKIVEIGNREEIFARPVHPYTQALMRLAAASTIASASTKMRFPLWQDGEIDEMREFLPA
jgi:ABC-type dipeptide/oligopeptide/nickel transport system ATPase component